MLKIVFFLLSLFTVAFYGPAQANILITPTQVVFDDRERFAVVTLANVTNNTVSYELEWKLFKMTEVKGTYEPVEFAPEYDMSKLVFFAPRRVTLSPKGKQKIKLRFSRPSDIPDGDYHVHLKFKSIPVELDENNQPIEKSLVQVGVKVSYTIPVVVRIGEAQVTAQIGQIGLDRDQNTGQLNMRLPVTRGEGATHSILGHLRIYNDTGNGEEVLVGEISNANLFPEVRQRVFSIPLKKEVTGGTLRVELRHFKRDNNFVYAERSFPLQ